MKNNIKDDCGEPSSTSKRRVTGGVELWIFQDGAHKAVRTVQDFMFPSLLPSVFKLSIFFNSIFMHF